VQASSIDFDKYITTYADFPKPGILFRDVSPLLASARGMNCAINQLASQVAGMKPDLVAGIESRGFLFSTLLAARLGIGSMMIRKPGKLPGRLVDETYDLEYGSATLTVQADAPVAGRSVLLIDDLLATGGTMLAANSLLRSCGAMVPASVVIVELAALGGRALLDMPLIALLFTMTKFDPRTTLLVVALESELPRDLLAGWQIVYSGVGKVNAAITLCDALASSSPKTVVNYGSAGALRTGLSGLYRVTRFQQRDMDVRALGFSLGQTPFEEDMIIDLDGDGLSCGTGDNFVSTPPEMNSDLVDMEAYALAKICRQKAVEFHCFKFISDNANNDAANDWMQKLALGAKLFSNEVLKKHSSFG